MELTEREREIYRLKELTVNVYTWDEVKKLIKAYEKKYNISPCDLLPYDIKPIRVFMGIQVLDLEKFK